MFFSEQTRQSYYDNNSDQSTDLILIGYLINGLKTAFFKNIYKCSMYVVGNYLLSL